MAPRVDDDRRPVGWVEPTRIGDRPVAEADLHRGGTVAREHGSLRGALDAALSSPSRRGVSSTTLGCCAARCRRTRCSPPSSTSTARARRVRPGARRCGRGARRRGHPVTWLADNWRTVLDLAGRSLYLAGIPLIIGFVVSIPLGLGRQPLVARLPGDHHHDRAALHDPVAGAVRHHADRAGHQDPRPGERHRRHDDLHGGAARAHGRRRAQRRT